MKKIVNFFLIFILIIPNIGFGNNFDYTWENYFNGTHNIDDKLKRSNICGVNTYKEGEEIIDIVTSIEYPDPVEENEPFTDFISKGWDIYQENMSNIYKCSMISTQIDVIENRIGTLTDNTKTPRLKIAVGDLFEKIKKDLNKEFEEYECRDHSEHSTFDKQNVLKRVTHETCEFNFYMEYLKEYYLYLPNVRNILEELGKSNHNDDVPYKANITALEIRNYSIKKIQDANLNIDKAYRIFPIAYDTYLDFENNFPLHILLNSIRQAYISFRDVLYEGTRPIDQVIYKIHNAMKAP